MATDLPAFDSVWIDALVQMRKLTPFQAKILESQDPRRLKVGPCVLVERLGGGFHGTTYLARSITTRQLRVIKVVHSLNETLPETWLRTQLLLAKSAKFVHPSIVTPRACERIDQSLVFVSRYIPGWTLTEFLVRRGRYPARMVWQIGRQLADGLAKLHAAGLAHGDIRPSQVRLLSEGTAVLVDAGIQAVLEPELSPHSQLTPECYDCVAPELIGTGLAHNPASDLYALGCLLWQLLAGRPPFPGGDPLQKLASHQTRRIRDVRDFAPDTPAELAILIFRMTSPNVSERPASAAAILKIWGPPRRSGRMQLKRFVDSFQHPITNSFRPSSLANSPVAWLLALLLCVSGLTFGLAKDSARTTLMQIWAKLPNGLNPGGVSTTVANEASVATADSVSPSNTQSSTSARWLPLPEPDARGLIQLSQRGPYAARKISQVGILEIRGARGGSEIMIDGTPLFLNAAKVILQDLDLRVFDNITTPSASTSIGRVQVEALELEVRHSRFLSSPPPTAVATREATRLTVPSTQQPLIQHTALNWKVTEASSPQSGFAKLENLVFQGSDTGFGLNGAAREISLKNVLRLGSGPLIAMNVSSTRELKVNFEHVTSRQSGSVLRWDVADLLPTKQRIRIDSKNCVFDMLPGKGGLLEFAGQKHVMEWARQVQFVGDSCLLSDSSEIAVYSDLNEPSWTAIDSSELELEGFTQQAFDFFGKYDLNPANSAIKNDYNGVRSRSGLPGIVASLLPGKVSTGAVKRNVRSSTPVAALPVPKS